MNYDDKKSGGKIIVQSHSRVLPPFCLRLISFLHYSTGTNQWDLFRLSPQLSGRILFAHPDARITNKWLQPVTLEHLLLLFLKLFHNNS